MEVGGPTGADSAAEMSLSGLVQYPMTIYYVIYAQKLVKIFEISENIIYAQKIGISIENIPKTPKISACGAPKTVFCLALLCFCFKTSGNYIYHCKHTKNSLDVPTSDIKLTDFPLWKHNICPEKINNFEENPKHNICPT